LCSSSDESAVVRNSSNEAAVVQNSSNEAAVVWSSNNDAEVMQHSATRLQWGEASAAVVCAAATRL